MQQWGMQQDFKQREPKNVVHVQGNKKVGEQCKVFGWFSISKRA